MLPRFLKGALALAATAAAVAACAPSEVEVPDEDAPDVAEALTPGSVAAMITSPQCSTRVVRGLTEQLVAELECIKPGALTSIEGMSGIELDEDAFPYLQTPAAKALANAQRDLGSTIKVNSALRTIPQQFLLYRWYKNGRCGISLAAKVGESNHEEGLAVDLDSHGTSVRRAMSRRSYAWLGASDPVHFDYNGSDGVAIQGASVRAFKRLWNRNHPEKPLTVNDTYDAKTESYLRESPAAGFPIGARCD